MNAIYNFQISLYTCLWNFILIKKQIKLWDSFFAYLKTLISHVSPYSTIAFNVSSTCLKAHYLSFLGLHFYIFYLHGKYHGNVRSDKGGAELQVEHFPLGITFIIKTNGNDD